MLFIFLLGGFGTNVICLFFADDNSDELAEKMIWAIEHHQNVQQMISAAQIEAQKYKWENIRQKIYNVYGK